MLPADPPCDHQLGQGRKPHAREVIAHRKVSLALGRPVHLSLERCARCGAIRAHVTYGTLMLVTPWGTP